MPIPAVRIIKPENERNFGHYGDAVEVPSSVRRAAQVVRPLLAAGRQSREAPAHRPGRSAAGNLSHRKLRQDPEPRLHQVRTGQAALRPGRMPAAPPHLWPAVPRLAAAQKGTARRGRGLSRRHAHHDRRRRIHHQRGRARGRVASCTARPASIMSSKPKRATAVSTAAGSSPNAAAGSRSTSPRRRP